nr:hypothetical protein [Tanacetum cinerariifolium]
TCLLERYVEQPARGRIGCTYAFGSTSAGRRGEISSPLVAQRTVEVMTLMESGELVPDVRGPGLSSERYMYEQRKDRDEEPPLLDDLV